MAYHLDCHFVVVEATSEGLDTVAWAWTVLRRGAVGLSRGTPRPVKGLVTHNREINSALRCRWERGDI